MNGLRIGDNNGLAEKYSRHGCWNGHRAPTQVWWFLKEEFRHAVPLSLIFDMRHCKESTNYNVESWTMCHRSKLKTTFTLGSSNW